MGLTFHDGWFPGVVGDIAALHARHFAASHGFGAAFEAEVARGLGGFLAAGRGFFRAASRDGRALGALALDPEADGGHGLRWVILDPALRGQGIARRWLHEAVLHACHAGADAIRLRMPDGLDDAARLCAAIGFREAGRAAGTRWGREATEILLELRRPPQRVMS